MSLADAKYVSFTTYRRNGEAVATPVWIAPLSGGRAAFTTAADSAKVKRLRNDPRVLVQVSDVRGRVAPGAEQAEGTAEVVVGGAGFEEIRAAVASKYGIQFRLVHLGGRLKKLIGRGAAADCGIVITFASA
jgi:PPOX class probable F420-dependent enzyme